MGAGLSIFFEKKIVLGFLGSTCSSVIKVLDRSSSLPMSGSVGLSQLNFLKLIVMSIS